MRQLKTEKSPLDVVRKPSPEQWEPLTRWRDREGFTSAELSPDPLPGFQSLEQQADWRCLDWEGWLFSADTVPAGILAEGNRDQHGTGGALGDSWLMANVKKTQKLAEWQDVGKFIGRAVQNWKPLRNHYLVFVKRQVEKYKFKR